MSIMFIWKKHSMITFVLYTVLDHWNLGTHGCLCVVPVIVEIHCTYPSTAGLFSAAIGYVVLTPKHVHLLFQKSYCI